MRKNIIPFEAMAKLAYTTKETCALVGISARSLQRLEQRRLLVPCKALRTKLFSAKSIEEFLEKNI